MRNSIPRTIVAGLAALARKRGLKLALLPGDRLADARLEEASTLPRGAV